MMGQFLGQSLKKCLHFFPLFELGFLYTTTTYFQKMSSIRKLAIQLYYVLYNNTLLQKKNTNYTIVFQYFWFFTKYRDGVFYIYLYLQQTLLKVHFFYLEKSHCTILCTLQMVYCQTMTAILTVLPSLKITHPYQPPFPNSQFSHLSDLSKPPCYI